MTSRADEFAALDATAQAELVHSGQVQPGDLVDAAIARIEALDPRLNAIIHPLFERARDAARASTLPTGAFRGVPFVVKDAVCQTEGDPYHLGCRFLKALDWRAPADTELARRFRACGFVFVGRSNTPEFAASVTTEPLAYGPTRNPWNLDYSTGGSSGGSAAAVAAGLVPAAHGNDMGGSIRIPAGACGLVGLKPTRARNSLSPDFGEYWGPLTHEHVLTRSVRDTAAILDATAGPAPGDPYWAPAPLRPWSEELNADPGRLRIGFRTHLAGGRLAAEEGVEAVEQAAALLASMGHVVESVEVEALDDPGLMAGVGIIMMVSVARDVKRWSERIERPLGAEDLEPMTYFMAERGRAIDGPQYVEAVEALQAGSRRLAAWWSDGWDLLLTPTSGRAPQKIGLLGPERPIEELSVGLGEVCAFTAPFNASGQPAISLPLHQTVDGLPVGVQLVAAYGREDLLIRIASQLESARPWPLLTGVAESPATR